MTQFTASLVVCAMGVATLACNDQPTEPLPPVMGSASTLPTEGVPGWQLADTPKVVLLDDAGHPVSGVEVTWTVREGGGSVVPVNTVTDAEGMSAALWTLGPVAGANALHARTADGADADFAVRGTVFHADKLAADGAMACGLVGTSLWCWGPGFWANGEPVSEGPYPPANVSPGLVDDLHAFTDIAVSGSTVCGLDPAQAVWCSTGASHALQEVSGLPAARQLVGANNWSGSGRMRFCTLAASDSTAWCWRVDSVPAPVVGSPAFAAIWVANANRYSASPARYNDYRGCGVVADSTAYCWGVGQPGNGSLWGGLDSAVAVTGGGWVELAVGDRFSCGRLPSGEVDCWGGPDLTPTLPTAVGSGATLLGASQARVLTVQSPGQYQHWWAPVGPMLLPPTGLPNVGVLSMAYNTVTCLRMAGNEVYCSDELGGGVIVGELAYYPVQPVRTEPLTSRGVTMLAAGDR